MRRGVVAAAGAVLLTAALASGANDDAAEMIAVPADDFTMGAPDGEGLSNEHPPHAEHVAAFQIDRTEVTRRRYQACVDAHACDPPHDAAANGGASGANHPVVNVSWEDAARFCKWADKRLPTEKEWEYAARGRDGRRYPWGNEPPDGRRLNFCDAKCPYEEFKNSSHNDGFAKTAPVGSYPAGRSPFGVLDLAGNVWEWVADVYDPRAYERPPHAPPAGGPHVLRGGSFDGSLGLARATMRYAAPSDPKGEGFDDVGFRCAK